MKRILLSEYSRRIEKQLQKIDPALHYCGAAGVSGKVKTVECRLQLRGKEDAVKKLRAAGWTSEPVKKRQIVAVFKKNVRENVIFDGLDRQGGIKNV